MWEQEEGHSQSWGQRGRQRSETLETITSPPKKKKSKANLVVDAIDMDEWESQEQPHSDVLGLFIRTELLLRTSSM